jgi:hypothetical protein
MVMVADGFTRFRASARKAMARFSGSRTGAPLFAGAGVV